MDQVNFIVIVITLGHTVVMETSYSSIKTNSPGNVLTSDVITCFTFCLFRLFKTSLHIYHTFYSVFVYCLGRLVSYTPKITTIIFKGVLHRQIVFGVIIK